MHNLFAFSEARVKAEPRYDHSSNQGKLLPGLTPGVVARLKEKGIADLWSLAQFLDVGPWRAKNIVDPKSLYQMLLWDGPEGTLILIDAAIAMGLSLRDVQELIEHAAIEDFFARSF